MTCVKTLRAGVSLTGKRNQPVYDRGGAGWGLAQVPVSETQTIPSSRRFVSLERMDIWLIPEERLIPIPSLLCSPDVTALCCPRTGVCQPLPTVGASGNQSCTQQETDRALKPFNQREFAKTLIGRDKATIKRL